MFTEKEAINDGKKKYIYIYITHKHTFMLFVKVSNIITIRVQVLKILLKISKLRYPAHSKYCISNIFDYFDYQTDNRFYEIDKFNILRRDNAILLTYKEII